MDPGELSSCNNFIGKHELLYFDGGPVQTKMTAGLISSSGQYGYAIDADILVLLKQKAIVLHSGITQNHQPNDFEIQQGIQEFYEETGWKKHSEKVFVDAAKFEDLRPVSSDYIRRCHMRVRHYLKKNGKYCLDVASGPIQYEEYLSYSDGFEYRICVDLSWLALKQAKERIGRHGIYVIADIANLPLIDNVVEAIVSLHTLYHVPENEQNLALRELFRVLKPGCSAVVVYFWAEPSRFREIVKVPYRILQSLLSTPKTTLKGVQKANPPQSGLYSYFQTYKRFMSQHWNFELDIVVWRSISVPFLRTYIHGNLLGRQILSMLFWLEDQFPHFFGRFGRYPMFVIVK